MLGAMAESLGVNARTQSRVPTWLQVSAPCYCTHPGRQQATAPPDGRFWPGVANGGNLGVSLQIGVLALCVSVSMPLR